MRPMSYRLTLIGSALAWLLLGLHLPTLHEVIDHGWRPPMAVLVMMIVLALAGLGTLWMLLRASPRGTGSGG